MLSTRAEALPLVNCDPNDLGCVLWNRVEQLVQSVIREIKPQVVMLELDAERTFLLPPGTPYQVRDGRWRSFRIPSLLLSPVFDRVEL